MPQPTMYGLLTQLGLTIAKHPDGYRYLWRGRLWVGPYTSEVAALQAAFDEAIEIMNTERPYGQSTDGIWWKWDNGWQYIGKQAILRNGVIRMNGRFLVAWLLLIWHLQEVR